MTEKIIEILKENETLTECKQYFLVKRKDYQKVANEIEAAINYTRCCETSIADLQISDKITFKQHRSGIITDVYINELQVKDVNGNYKTIGKNDVIEKH
jgi:hypothetical protein